MSIAPAALDLTLALPWNSIRLANVHFVQVHAPDQLQVKVWERGAGPTLACGTGACATVVATHLRGACARQVTVQLPGGPLQIDWDRNNHIQMAGPAVFVFEGVLPTASGGEAVEAIGLCSDGCIRPEACPGAVNRRCSDACRSMTWLAWPTIIGGTRRRAGSTCSTSMPVPTPLAEGLESAAAYQRHLGEPPSLHPAPAAELLERSRQRCWFGFPTSGGVHLWWHGG